MFLRPLSALFIASLVCGTVALPGQPQLALLTGNAKAEDTWGWESCGEPTDPVQIKSISVSPDPPKIGADLTVTVDLQVVETIEEGATADVLVKVGRIKLLQQTFDLCDEARKANATVSCPVEPGLYSIVQTVALPKEVPKLKYVINVQGYTKDEEPLTCVDLTVQFRPFFQLWE
ncbi:ML domain-containing protein [Mycena alexandri]|uniref:Phosphatidylglycerol/phosphatidylinositol transfer protein n=1 Tax=Mycena alexandri TaxID=1745969 RepID=A0AAD6X7W6_9AGAR|nr:ML domain-containing protein [Mycena alexandri]